MSALVNSASHGATRKVLLSSIGSRGEVQPLLALALELKNLHVEPVICVAPNFKAWIESFDVRCVPVGPDLEKFSIPPGKRKRPPKSQLRELIRHTVRDQFAVLSKTAADCDAIFVAGALQTAGRSIAEVLGIPYIYSAYCPSTLRSPDHPPPRIRKQTLPKLLNRALWSFSERSWNRVFLEALNEERVRLGLKAERSVPRYIETAQPLIAADPVLAPRVRFTHANPVHVGAWLLHDPTPLPAEVEAFLNAGEPPIYCGFGSIKVSQDIGQVAVRAARALGHRTIVSRGWANLDTPNDASCLSIGDVSHRQLLPRVAAVIHHGGAGTTTAAAIAGRPQLVVPQMYDQFYWAHRIERLGIGAAHLGNVTAESLTAGLRSCLQPETVAHAKALSSRIDLSGAQRTAQRIIENLPMQRRGP